MAFAAFFAQETGENISVFLFGFSQLFAQLWTMSSCDRTAPWVVTRFLFLLKIDQT